jgi:hypothetical protein
MMALDWAGLLKSLFQVPGPSGSPVPGASAMIPLSSGYDRGVDVARAVALLTRLQTEAIAMFPADPLPGGKWMTKCNFGMAHVADGLGCRDLDGVNATCMTQRALRLCATTPGDWQLDMSPGWTRAVSHAQRGGLAFFGMEARPGELHGHVTSVAARPPEYSGTWGAVLPVCANVGKPEWQGFVRLSKCFTLDERPLLRCFLWKPGMTA